MSGEQWATGVVIASVLVWPTWRGLVELFWRGYDWWLLNRADAKPETYGPRALYGPVDLVDLITWHSQRREQTDHTTPSTVPAVTSTPAAGTATPADRAHGVARILEVEHTGPVTRVWVTGDADAVADAARAHLGTEALADVNYFSEGDVYEVVFERADLDEARGL